MSPKPRGQNPSQLAQLGGTDLRSGGLRPLTIIESPFAGDEARNLLYLRACLRDSFERGETPFASHGFFPFFLRESLPEERKRGIEMGHQFWPFASLIAFYIDYGVSPGMAAALSRCRSFGRVFELRTLKELP